MQDQLGLSESGLVKLRKSLGNVYEDKQNNRIRVFAPEWFKAWARYTSGVLTSEGEVDQPDAASPWLEEGRKWKALQERDKYEESSGKLISSDTVRHLCGVVAGAYRQAGDNACERCKVLIDDALTSAEQEAESYLRDRASEIDGEAADSLGSEA